MTIGAQKQGAGEAVPAFPVPEGAWHPLLGTDDQGAGNVAGTLRDRPAPPGCPMDIFGQRDPHPNYLKVMGGPKHSFPCFFLDWADYKNIVTNKADL